MNKYFSILRISKLVLTLSVLGLNILSLSLPTLVLANNTPNQTQDQQDLQRYIDRENGVSYGPGLGSTPDDNLNNSNNLSNQNNNLPQDRISKAESDLNTKAQENSNLTQNPLSTQSSTINNIYPSDLSYDILSGEIIKGTGVITIPQYGIPNTLIATPKFSLHQETSSLIYENY